MRRAANIDTVQPEIAKKLKQAGVKVAYLHPVGGGVPDLLCGFRGRNILVELKTGSDKLNKEQVDWHASWPGQVGVARDFAEAMAVILEALK